MAEEEVVFSIRAVEIAQDGDYCCESCDAAVAFGTWGIVAGSDGVWYMVSRAGVCEHCACNLHIPILCYADERAATVADVIVAMKGDLGKFVLMPLRTSQMLS